MDNRCPACGYDMGKRKLAQAIIAQSSVECTGCKRRLQFNVHPAENAIVLFNFSAIVGLGALGYWYESQRLVLVAVGAAALGSAALPILERTYLRNWPRYIL